ncbi:MAG: YkvA family protein [Burkholderiaceae bacterium]
MWLARAGFLLKRLGRNGIMLIYALRHPGTPRGVKLGILGLLLYVVSPIDLVPDFAALIGITDDAAVLLVGIPFLMKKLPVDVQQDVSEKVSRLLARFGFGESPSN